MESQLVKTTARELRFAEIETAISPVAETAPPVVSQTAPAASDERISTDGQREAEQQKAPRKPLIRFDEEEPIVYRSKLEQQPPGPFPSLVQLIDEKNRKLFVRKVFDRDADASEGYTGSGIESPQDQPLFQRGDSIE
jgi:hypothetical protein